MKETEEIQIIHLFLSKLELLTENERAVLINTISLISNPRYEVSGDKNCNAVILSTVEAT